MLIRPVAYAAFLTFNKWGFSNANNGSSALCRLDLFQFNLAQAHTNKRKIFWLTSYLLLLFSLKITYSRMFPTPSLDPPERLMPVTQPLIWYRNCTYTEIPSHWSCLFAYIVLFLGKSRVFHCTLWFSFAIRHYSKSGALERSKSTNQGEFVGWYDKFIIAALIMTVSFLGRTFNFITVG